MKRYITILALLIIVSCNNKNAKTTASTDSEDINNKTPEIEHVIEF